MFNLGGRKLNSAPLKARFIYSFLKKTNKCLDNRVFLNSAEVSLQKQQRSLYNSLLYNLIWNCALIHFKVLFSRNSLLLVRLTAGEQHNHKNMQERCSHTDTKQSLTVSFCLSPFPGILWKIYLVFLWKIKDENSMPILKYVGHAITYSFKC